MFENYHFCTASYHGDDHTAIRSIIIIKIIMINIYIALFIQYVTRVDLVTLQGN